MSKEWTKAQPIAYAMLSHDLSANDTSYAYLFQGPKGSHKGEAAIDFVKAIMCENTKDGWGCDECNVCRRIGQREYLDVQVIDGTDANIKKEEVSSLLEYFSQTAMEKRGKKAYIILAVDKMTQASMNSILKFLEEPGQDITAILTTEQPSRLLPTIVSRCKMIPFVAPSRSSLEKEALNQGLDPLNAHLLSSNVDESSQLVETSELDAYQSALSYVQEFLRKCRRGIDEGIFYLNDEAFPQKERSKKKDVLAWFLKIGLVLGEDVLFQRKGVSESWDKTLEDFHALGISARKWIMVLCTCKDNLLVNAQTGLVIDQMGYLLRKEVQHGNDRK